MPPDDSAAAPSGLGRAFPAILILIGVALAVAAHLRIGTSVIDDAWITWRYSANLAGGDGLVYNVGERVLGTTTPAWAILLGGLGALFGAESIPAISRFANLLLLLAGAGVAFQLVRALGGSAIMAGAAVAVWLIAPYQLFSSVGGMETPLFSLLAISAIHLAIGSRLRGAAVLAGLSVWVRPEGIFLIGLILGRELWLRWRGDGAPGPSMRDLAIVAALALAPLLIMVGWMWASYGLPWPHSIEAKRAGLYDLTIAESFTLVRSGLSASYTLAPELGFFGLGVVPVLLIGAVAGVRAAGRLLLPMAFLAILFVFFSTSRTLPFPHYFALFEPWAIVAWGAAGWVLVKTLGGWSGMSERGSRRAIDGIAVALVVQPLLFFPWYSVAGGAPTNRDAAYPAPLFRTVYYEVAAEQIEPVLPDGSRIVLPEIGVLGWEFADHHIIDAAGLVSPEALAFLPVADSLRAAPDIGAIPPGLVRSSNADLILTLDLFGNSGLFRQRWFIDEWEQVWIWSDPGLSWGPLRAWAPRGSEVGARLRELPLGIPARP